MYVYRILFVCAALTFAAAPAALAQRWEFGAGAGGSFYNTQSIANAAGSVSAGFKPGFAGTAYLGQTGNRYGGEIRYSYMQNRMELKGANANFDFGGRSHALHYDFVYNTGDAEAKTRGFFAAGAGIKIFSGTGQDVPIQPLGRIAVLTRTSEWKPLVSAAAGVKYALGGRATLRLELRAYFTPAPREVITPLGAGKLDGWFFNLLPMVSVSF